ncbi:hypothetical protein PTI98_006241 [Pleurotus ostreatus]|nr:hypothetical protein PTI98_006241 [Pleurotus ostreatus]
MHLPLTFVASSLFFLSALSRETVWDAAAIARRLVDNSTNSIGVMATVFPPDHSSSPAQPFAMQEYYASCHTNGSLTLLFLPISRHSQNILHSNHHAASLSVSSALPAARSPRVSLIGNVTVYANTTVVPDRNAIQSCYLARHPDARWWLPDDDDAAHIVRTPTCLLVRLHLTDYFRRECSRHTGLVSILKAFILLAVSETSTSLDTYHWRYIRAHLPRQKLACKGV